MDESFVRQVEILRADGAEVRILNNDEVSFWKRATDYESVQDKWIEGDEQAAKVLKELRRLLADE